MLVGAADPRFLCPRFPIVVDMRRYHKAAAQDKPFLARPVKIREQGPTAHWKTRMENKEADHDFDD